MSDDQTTESASTPAELTAKTTTKQSDTPLTYRVATLEDCEPLCSLVSDGYRGEVSCQGWTTEHWLLGGQRVDVESLADIINDNANVVLAFFDPTKKTLVGCVHLQHKPATETVLLGMLTVRPNLQNQGYGKFILAVGENYAVNNWNVEYVEMNVILQRPELIEYYNRRGYADTGKRTPFPMDNPRFGLPKRTDLQFCIMEKRVKKT